MNRISAKGRPDFNICDMYLVRTLDIKVKILENIHKMLGDSRIIHAMEAWGWDGQQKETDKIHGIFCEQIRMPTFAANSKVMKRLQKGHRDVHGNEVLVMPVIH